MQGSKVRDRRDLSPVCRISTGVDGKAIISINVTFQLVGLSQINENNPATKILPTETYMIDQYMREVEDLKIMQQEDGTASGEDGE